MSAVGPPALPTEGARPPAGAAGAQRRTGGEHTSAAIAIPGRRRCLHGIAALIAMRLLPAAAAAEAMPSIPMLLDYVAGRPVRWERVRLELPQLADNGLVVPAKLAVAGPFPAGAHVASLRLYSEANPVPDMAVFEYPVAVSRVELDTRIRLATSQRIVAIATLADRSLLGAVAEVIVTIAGCMDGT